jgi:hypothetical protein
MWFDLAKIQSPLNAIWIEAFHSISTNAYLCIFILPNNILLQNVKRFFNMNIMYRDFSTLSTIVRSLKILDLKHV